MVYCISDIHGHYNEFMTLLECINFQSDDVLYVLGDAVDRGPEPMKCLQFIMRTPNIHMLMGNHDQMMLEAMTDSALAQEHEIKELWIAYNGGYETYMQFQSLSDNEQKEVLGFVKSLPYYKVLQIRSQKYLLVHAGLDLRSRQPREHLSTTLKRQHMDYPCDLLWIRNEFIRSPGLPEYTIIFGHTPGKSIPGHRKDKIYHGWHSNTLKIGIDCGCCYDGRLAALRLDDMKEFYVDREESKDNMREFERFLEKIGAHSEV